MGCGAQQSVFVTPPAGHDPRSVFTDDPLACPETFRSTVALADFQRADRQTHLLRFVHVKQLAHLSGEDADVIWGLAQDWIRRADPGDPAGDDLTRILEEAAWSPLCDHRPVFAAFYEDFADDLARPDWPDRMRDRLGLYHLSQLYPRGLPARVVLFRYPVEALPRRPRERDTRLMAIPTVLDHAFSLAFCPAPRELNRGRVLDLTAGAVTEPVREIVHPFLVFKSEHLFRVGEVTKPVPEALDTLRRDHLVWLQLLTGRDNYARETDGDLLA
jgi:hypothetical protein